MEEVRNVNTKSNSLALACKIFDWSMIQEREPRMARLQELVPELLASKQFYLVADGDTQEKDWKSREFGVSISDKQELLVFLNRSDAVSFAKKNERLLSDETPMIICISYDALAKLVLNYSNKQLIKKVKIYARVPLFLFCLLAYFQQHQIQDAPKSLMTASVHEEEKIQYPDQKFKMVEDVKKVLDLAEVSKRRAIDPGLICENLHSVIEKLIHYNRLDMSEMEKQLQLPPGMLRVFCKDRVSSSISKAAAVKLLKYFGLEAYLYQYKRYCNEVWSELNADDTIDICEIKPASFKTEEKFKLTNVRRGNDTRNQAYIYELTLKSKNREVKLMVSTPLNYVVGKSYEIIGLDVQESRDENLPELNSTEKEKPTQKAAPKTNEHMDIPMNRPAVNLSSSVSLEGPSGAPRQRRSQDEIDHDMIIRYCKETYSDNLMAAEEKIRALEPHSDIIHAFAQYIKTKRPGRIKEFEYTPGMLMNTLHYEPYEAYLMMAKLRNKPSETKQLLVYRKTAPQYQKKKEQQES